MIDFSLDGYGGEYTIGKLTSDEIKNIKILLNRFDPQLIIGHYELSFSDDRTEFSDFDDIYHGWGATYIGELSDYECTISFDFDEINEDRKNITVNETGYYLMTCSIEKGNFGNIQIDISSDEFDKSKLMFQKDDLTNTWLNSTILISASYCGIDIEINSDYSSTSSKSFDQFLTFYDETEDEYFNGIDEILFSMEKPKYNVLKFIPFGSEARILWQFIEIYNKKETVEIQDGYLVYFSPLIEELHGKKVCEYLWMSSEEHIKTVLKYDMLDEIPKYIMDKIVKDKPEWLL